MSIGVEAKLLLLAVRGPILTLPSFVASGAHAMTTGAWKLSELFSLSRLQGLSQNVGSQIRENAGRESPNSFCMRRNLQIIFIRQRESNTSSRGMAEVGTPRPCLRLLRKVGEGSFGQVFKALWRDHNASAEKRVALKRVAVRDTSGRPTTQSCDSPASPCSGTRASRAEKPRC